MRRYWPRVWSRIAGRRWSSLPKSISEGFSLAAAQAETAIFRHFRNESVGLGAVQVERGTFAEVRAEAIGFSAGQSHTVGAAQLQWKPALPLPAIVEVQRSGFFDLVPYLDNPGATLADIQEQLALPSGADVTITPTPRITATAGATLGDTAGMSLLLVPSAVADYQSRISGPGVVWHHNFDAVAEVNAFRWSNQHDVPGFGGNDPNSVEFGSEFVTHVASGGADGGGFLRVSYPAGDPDVTGAGNAYWWRPMNPLNTPGNGRPTADPAANNTLTRSTWSVSSGSSTLGDWVVTQSNPGWYMHPTHQAANPGKFQGSEFWFQYRVRRAQNPGPPPDNLPSYTSITGKNAWLTTTKYTYTTQELVTFGQSVAGGDVIGTQSRMDVYLGESFLSIGGLQSNFNSTVTISNHTVGWRYTGGWDTVMYKITPGTSGGTGANRTRVEVWAQRDLTLFPAEAGLWTKVWDVLMTVNYDTNGVNPLPGWNAVVMAAYHNGSHFVAGGAFQYDYDQIIFSKAAIPAPNA